MDETTTAFDVEAYNYDLDKGLETVMPDSWVGHQRIKNYEMFYPEAVEE